MFETLENKIMIKPTRRRIDYSGLSVKTLKVELAVCGVSTEGFVEKSEFVKALEDVKRDEKKKASRKPARRSRKQTRHVKDEKVLYISSNGEIAESARILEIHWTEGDDPYYIIRLDVSGRERQTDGAHLVALPGKQSVESPQTANKSDGKLKKAFENLKHLGKNDALSCSTRSSRSVEPKSRSLPLRSSSFSLSLPSRRKEDLSTASTHSTSSSGSSFSFFHHKPQKPQRRSTGSIRLKPSPRNSQLPALRPARRDFIEVRPIKSVRMSSPGSSASSVSPSHSVRSTGSQYSAHREQVFKTRSGTRATKPGSASGFVEPKLRTPPARASSFSMAASSRQRREKRHALRPSPSQGKGKHPTQTIQRSTSLPTKQRKPRPSMCKCQ